MPDGAYNKIAGRVREEVSAFIKSGSLRRFAERYLALDFVAEAERISRFMEEWKAKDGYDTRVLAGPTEMSAPGVEIQLLRFHHGKFEHYHKRKTEFFYFTGGAGKVVLEGEERALGPGSFLVVRPGVRHTFINESRDVLLEGIMVKTNNDPTDTYRD